MAAEDVFETVSKLTEMKATILGGKLLELRQADMLNSRERIDAICKSGARTGIFSGKGGNTPVYTQTIKGKTVETQLWDISMSSLRMPGIDDPDIAIYPYGIADVTDRGLPIFGYLATNNKRSIVLEYPPIGSNMGWLQRPIEPLFNIDDDGRVNARMHDEPTPTELQLLQNILGRFEAEIAASGQVG